MGRSELKYHVRKQFHAREDLIDIELVLEKLISDYKLVVSLGDAYIRLTILGEQAAKRGFANYRKNLGIKDWWQENPVAAIITSIISAILSSLVTYLLTL